MASNTTPLQRATVQLGIETALLANGSNLVTLIGFIIKKSTEVCRFKGECTKLINLCIALSVSFTENQSAMEHVKSGQKFLECLQDVLLLLNQCTEEWSIRHIGWEIFVKGRLETLQKDLERCQQVFNMEVLINVKSSTSTTTRALSDMRAQLDTVHTSLTNNADTRSEFLASVQSLGQELEISRREMRSVEWIDQAQYRIIPIDDERLDIGTGATMHVRAVFDGHKVSMERIHADVGRSPRLLKIYKKIGDVSLVQQLFGVTEDRRGSRYVLMEDLSMYKTLASHIKTNAGAVITLMQKLQFAYDLASTLSSLHKNRVLVKNISDNTIFIKDSSIKTYKPVVSGLQEARDLFEPSSHISYDVRYEAPEVNRAGMHSEMSDIWSLGILLIQWFTGISPLVSDQARMQEDAANTNVTGRSLSEEPQVAGIVLAQISLPPSASILWECLLPNPFMRPTSAVVAQRFLDSIMVEATREMLKPPGLKAKVENGLDNIIQKVQLGIKERKLVRQAVKKQQQIPEPIVWIKKSEYDQLLHIQADERPVIMYTVGAALLWGLVEPDKTSKATEETMGLPENVVRAKHALQHLQRAYDLGFNAATEELYYAHRALAEYYQSLTTERT